MIYLNKNKVCLGDDMVNYDLHVHTNASDGVLTPQEIFEMAMQANLHGISITDHDTVDALEKCESISFNYGLDFIPGIELSTDYKGVEVHILGYYINYRDKDFLEFLKVLQGARRTRAEKMVKILNELGYAITFDEVLELSGDNIYSLGRPHIARALINSRYFSNIDEVFNSLLIPGKAAYVERYKVSTEDAIKRIKDIGGVPVLAHPLLIKNFKTNEQIDDFVQKFIKYGLCGIEVYHSLHSDEGEQVLKSIAQKHNLIITGGSDFHSPFDRNKKGLGTKGISFEEVKKLKSYVR
jgi:predicted metal-dependent phosphoesterase TrpH